MDIGHALIRPLADVALSLDFVLEDLKSDQSHEKATIEDNAKKLRGLCKMLAIAKDSFNDPDGIEDIDLSDLLSTHGEVLSLLSGRKLNYPNKAYNIIFSKRELAAFNNIILICWKCHSILPKGSTVDIHYLADSNDKLFLRIQNEAPEVMKNIIKRLKVLKVVQIFTGLARSYQLAARNGWKIEYNFIDNKNQFDLIIPH